MRMLLQRNDVNPVWANNSGQTPPRWASGNGHEGIMRGP